MTTFINDILSEPLGVARRSGTAIGYMGSDIPQEIFMAFDGAATHLPWTPAMVTPFADSWLESGFAPWTRSILEAWHEGEFDFLERVIFSRGSDNIQRLYYYICELQSRGVLAGPRAEIFDVAMIQRSTSLARNDEAVRKLCRSLDIDETALAGGIEKSNHLREKIAGILARRGTDGECYERLSRAMLFADPLDVVDHFEMSGPAEEKRLLLLGSMPPDDRIHRTAERSGWTIADEYYDNSLHRFGPKISTGPEGAFAAVARHVHENPYGPRAFSDMTRLLHARLDAVKADAVVIWMIEEDETLVWELPKLKDALEKLGIPYLALTRRSWPFDDGAADDISQFLEGVEK